MEGVDTVASLIVNGKHMLSTDNMFVRYVADLRSVLKAGRNHIQLHFKSKVKEADFNANTCDPTSSGSCPTSCWPKEYNGFCNVNFLRTEQCSFAWDWGPAFAPVGIWRPIYIVGSSLPYIRDTLVTTTQHSHRQW